MDNKSIIKPIINALKKLSASGEELLYFYRVIDKFCALWFGKKISIKEFKDIEIILLHEILGEFLRFEENNKRIALWLLAVNRCCYNFKSDLKQAKKELENHKKEEAGIYDNTLIEPLLENLALFEAAHNRAGIEELGKKDPTGIFIQWIDIYCTYIYPKLENKLDFYDKDMIIAMNFLLAEFLRHKSNGKRLALLVFAIMEACKQYSVNEPINAHNIITGYESEGVVVAGTEEAFVEELLQKLSEENNKQKNVPRLTSEPSTDDFLTTNYNFFIQSLSQPDVDAVNLFNTFIADATNILLRLRSKEHRLNYIKNFFNFESNFIADIDINNIRKINNSISIFSEQTKKRIKTILKKAKNADEEFFKQITNSINENGDISAINLMKLYFISFLIFKLALKIS